MKAAQNSWSTRIETTSTYGGVRNRRVRSGQSPTEPSCVAQEQRHSKAGNREVSCVGTRGFAENHPGDVGAGHVEAADEDRGSGVPLLTPLSVTEPSKFVPS
jgi:hypothetical protein